MDEDLGRSKHTSLWLDDTPATPAITQAVTRCWTEPLEDDATLLVVAVD